MKTSTVLAAFAFVLNVLVSTAPFAAEPPHYITGRIHFNINTNDYARTREFYRVLGFAHSIGGFPETNTLIMAQSLGMSAPYRMHAELFYLGPPDIDPATLTEPTGRMIDLIQWKEPANTAPAYSAVNRLGFARAVLSTSDLDADMAALGAFGTQFLGPPATRADGSRFAIARDPAGTFVELREEPGARPVLTNGSHVTAVHSIALNVSNFARSRAFYRRLGFTKREKLPVTESIEVARAMGLEAPFRRRGELLRHERDGSAIELIEWLKPRDSAPPYPAPINHPGIHRINYASTDLAADVARLKALGVRFLSPIAPCCTGDASRMGIIIMEDPDGAFVELLGAITPPGSAPPPR
jgi:catechol 2,3-dioxygenase-like lactoylglutathione lyase family enzyme